MGRKSIPPNQRAQPISFSLKPHLIEKIDDYANDLRFSRSKFLMEAVTQYILKADMGYMAASNNVNDMTLAQKVAVGLAALQEANREGETISKPVMDALRRELGVVEGETPEETAILDAMFAEYDEYDTDREVGGIVYELRHVFESKADAQREVKFHHPTHFARTLKIKGGEHKGKWGAYVSYVVKGA